MIGLWKKIYMYIYTLKKANMEKEKKNIIYIKL